MLPRILLFASALTPGLCSAGAYSGGIVLAASLDAPTLIRNLEKPGRDATAKPDEVIAALRLTPGQVIGDIGAGTGYFALRLARQVGPEGRVFAVDIEPRVLEELKRRAADEGLTNIVPVLAPPNESLLDEASCDLLFLHHVYVHLADRIAYVHHLRTRLKPGGRLAVIGWRKVPGIPGAKNAKPSGNALTTDTVAEELAAAGFSVVEDLLLLPQKYFLIAAPRR